jgi:hypothetical protein
MPPLRRSENYRFASSINIAAADWIEPMNRTSRAKRRLLASMTMAVIFSERAPLEE